MHSRTAIGPPAGCTTLLTERVPAWAAGCLTGLVFLAGLVLWARRLAGALGSAPGMAELACAGVVAALVVAAARLGWSLPPARERPGTDWMPWLPTAGLLLLGSALVLPGASVAGLVVFSGLVLIEEVVAWSLRRGGWRRPSAQSDVALRAAPEAAASEPGGDQKGGRDADEKGGRGEGLRRAQSSRGKGGDDEQERVTQHVIRAFTAAGDDVLRATLGVDMATGQRGATAHLAFCPPFAVTPQAQVIQTAGPACRIKLAQLLPYGARIEIKLAAPAPRELNIQVQFTASASGF